MISGLIAENALTAINKAALSDSIDSPKALFRAMEAPPGIEPGIKVLQTSALPLGYGAALPEKAFLFYQTSEKKASVFMRFLKNHEVLVNAPELTAELSKKA